MVTWKPKTKQRMALGCCVYDSELPRVVLFGFWTSRVYTNKHIDAYTFAITCFHQVGVSMIQLIRNYWPFNQCDHTSAGSCSVGDLWWTPPQKPIYIYICIIYIIYTCNVVQKVVIWFNKYGMSWCQRYMNYLQFGADSDISHLPGTISVPRQQRQRASVPFLPFFCFSLHPWSWKWSFQKKESHFAGFNFQGSM